MSALAIRCPVRSRAHHSDHCFSEGRKQIHNTQVDLILSPTPQIPVINAADNTYPYRAKLLQYRIMRLLRFLSSSV